MLTRIYSNNRQFLLEWNLEFPLDHWWRKKYNVPFNSPKHRAVSAIDMFYDWLEDHMFEDYVSETQEKNEKLKIYQETGKWLHVDAEQAKTDLIEKFDKIDISAFNFNSAEEEEPLEQEKSPDE
jgi:hypothetical protein